MSADLSRRGFIASIAASLGGLAMPSQAHAQPARPISLTNFRLFDGRSGSLREGLSILVKDSRIDSVAEGNPAPPDGVQVIDCGGRVLIPGLIDMHWHSLFAAVPLQVLLTGDFGYVYVAAVAEAERTLMRGFTTVRDLGGPAFALQQAIDQRIVPGPRIYPSGTMITSSGGHGDLRWLHEVPRGSVLSQSEQTGSSAIVDGPDQVTLRVREQLLRGASQIKLVGSGGVSSPRSPLDALTLTEPELRAGIQAAQDWNTYVAVHAYTPRAIQRAITAGATCIEHGHLMDEETAKMMAEKDIWLSTQPFLDANDTVPLTGESRAKMLQVFAGTDKAYTLAKQYKIKTAFGSDLLFSGTLTARQGTMLSHLVRWYTPAEILIMATSTNADLLALSGPRNPYPGKLGVVEDGALADLLLIDGNPLEDVGLLTDPGKNIVLIMKDGSIYKDTRPA
ncbi:MAG TPA: amidohydrolase family protein [Acidocella sp.]|nr:amidohydrolase family protein [Acidocella sp.]